MIETTSASPPFKSAVMPKSGSSCASSCAPMSGPNTSTVASQPSCCLLNVSKKAFHSSRGISRVGIIAPFLYIPVGNVSSGLAHHAGDDVAICLCHLPFSPRACQLTSLRLTFRCCVLISSPREQIAHLFVGRLREVFVPHADGVERFGRDGADDLVHAHAVLVAGLHC